MKSRGLTKQRSGVVVSDRMQKTVVVTVERTVMHPMYKKFLRRRTKLKAHDEQNNAKTGDTVRIMETRPLSKDKRWRVSKLIEKARVQAQKLFERDPYLQQPEHSLLAEAFGRFWGDGKGDVS